MANDIQVIQSGQVWFVETPQGRFGPMETLQEANNYVNLMCLALAAGNEIACTDEECLI